MKRHSQLLLTLALLGFIIGGQLQEMEFFTRTEKLLEVGQTFVAASSSPDQSKVAGYSVSNGQWTVQVLDSKGRALAPADAIQAPSGVVERLTWSDDGRHFAAAAGDSVLIYDFSNKLNKRLLSAAWQVREVAFRGDYLLARCNDNLFVWRRSDWKLVSRLRIVNLLTADLSRDGETLLLGIFGEGFLIYDVPNRKVERQVNQGQTPSFLSFCASDRNVMSAYRVRGIPDYAILHSVKTGQPASRALQHDQLEYSEVSEDGSRVLTRSGQIRRVWNTESSQILCEVEVEDSHLDSLSSDGQFLATSLRSQGLVKVYDTTDGREQATLAHSSPVTWLEFSVPSILDVVGKSCAVWRI